MKPFVVDTERAARLKAFVEAMHEKPVTWGVDDCSTWPAQWVSDETGKELAWPAYGSKDEAVALIDRSGGLVTLWDQALRPAGIFERHDEPQLGDVGVVQTADMGEVGGIFAVNRTFLWRHERGVMMLPVRRWTISKVWRI